jgi:hypothetical protein
VVLLFKHSRLETNVRTAVSGSPATKLPILAIPAILAISFCGPLPAFFSQPPTGHRRFVDNKHQTPIRPSGDRAVEAIFSRVSHAQLRIFRLPLILFSKTTHQTHFRPMANVILYHLFALLSRKKSPPFPRGLPCPRGGAGIYACGEVVRCKNGFSAREKTGS